MPRAAIYARFSSDLQNDRSIEDQIALCRDICGRAGYEIAEVFEDRALSGASTVQRVGFQSMMRAAHERRFEIIVAEDIDRLFRDEADFHTARKRLDFLKVNIHTAQGPVSRIEGSLRAMMSALFIENLVTHIRRGMHGVVREGRHCGGAAYGYRAVKGTPGELEIVEHEAQTIRRIYKLYLGGESPRDIAGRLNSEGVPPPRGGYWRASTINGDRQRAFGILRNELYVGRMIWNKTHKVRDPDSGRRLTRMNPESEWTRTNAPHLRIVDDETFTAAQQRREDYHIPDRRPARPGRRMLSGLLRCGCCGAGMTMKDYDHGRPRIICSRMAESRSCDNRRAYYLDAIERGVVSGLRVHMGSEAAIACYVCAYNEEQARLRQAVSGNADHLKARLATTEREIERTVSLIVKGVITDAEAEKHLPELRKTRDRLLSEIASIDRPAHVITLHQPAVEGYLAQIERLEDAINLGLTEGNREIAQAMRGLVQTATVMPAPAGTPPEIRVVGHLQQVLQPHAGGYAQSSHPAPSNPPIQFQFTVKAA